MAFFSVISVQKSDIVNDPLAFRLAMSILSGMVFAAIVIGIIRVFRGPLPLHIHVPLVILCGVVGAVIGYTIIKTLQNHEKKNI